MTNVQVLRAQVLRAQILRTMLVVLGTSLAIAPMRSLANELDLTIAGSSSRISVQSSSSGPRVRTQGAVFSGSGGTSVQLQVGAPNFDAFFPSPAFSIPLEADFYGNTHNFGGFSSSHSSHYSHQNSRWLPAQPLPQTHVSPSPHKVIIRDFRRGFVDRGQVERARIFYPVRPSRTDQTPVPH